jgi:hypothetical protein
MLSRVLQILPPVLHKTPRSTENLKARALCNRRHRTQSLIYLGNFVETIPSVCGAPNPTTHSQRLRSSRPGLVL